MVPSHRWIFFLKILFMEWETIGLIPMFTLSRGIMVAHKAILAVFMVMYDSPCSCKLTRKSNTIFIAGLYESIFHLEQKSCLSLIYRAYCFWVPFDHDCRWTNVGSFARNQSLLEKLPDTLQASSCSFLLRG